MSESIRTACRLRPSTKNSTSSVVRKTSNSSLRIDIGKRAGESKTYRLDTVFESSCSQAQVFEAIGRRIVDGCTEGYNGTIFAYGQTGSGKTHTMLGPSHVERSFEDSEAKGLIPRAAEALFSRLDEIAAQKGFDTFKFTVTCSFVELYNEEFYDLLDANQNKLNLRVGGKTSELVGVREVEACSLHDVMRVVFDGWSSRKVAETAMNRESSRSHAIFIINVCTEELNGALVNIRRARLNLVDLAGSERQAHSKTAGDRFKEATHINLSLSTLGRVIRTLEKKSAEQSSDVVPYRDSKLTKLLKDSLGGNSRTAVVVTVHPDLDFAGDSISTLNFAQSCSAIQNTVVANEDLTADTALAYKTEISRLTELLKNKDAERDSSLQTCQSRIEELQAELLDAHKEQTRLRNENELLSVKASTSSSFSDASGLGDITNSTRRLSLRNQKKRRRSQFGNDENASPSLFQALESSAVEEMGRLQKEVERLNEVVLQRDETIAKLEKLQKERDERTENEMSKLEAKLVAARNECAACSLDISRLQSELVAEKERYRAAKERIVECNLAVQKAHEVESEMLKKSVELETRCSELEAEICEQQVQNRSLRSQLSPTDEVTKNNCASITAEDTIMTFSDKMRQIQAYLDQALSFDARSDRKEEKTRPKPILT